MDEEFDFKAIFADGEAEKIEVDEMETVIRESWGTITHVAGGIYKDCLENGLPSAVGEYVAKEFLYGALSALRGGGHI